MENLKDEIDRRRKVAFNAIREHLTSEDFDDCITQFIFVHTAEFWMEYFGVECPTSRQVSDKLTFQSHFGNYEGEEGVDEEDVENGIDNFDFSLPRNATDYVICVRFDRNGDIADIVVES